MNYDCISADCHIDLSWLPPDLFTRNARRSLVGSMPSVTDSADGPVWANDRGAQFGLVCGVGASGRKYVPGQLRYRVDRMAGEGLYDEASRKSRRLTDPHQRVKDQNRDGVQAEVLYGILNAVNSMEDPRAAAEMARIYNDWLAEFCAVYPQRLIGLAVIPSTDLDLAIEELRRVARMGFRGVEIACARATVPFFEKFWEPFWTALDEYQLPVHFHATPTALKQGARAPRGPGHWSKEEEGAASAVQIAAIQLGSVDYLTSIIFGGALERHPGMRVVFGESGIGWIPYILDRMDFGWEDKFRNVLGLKMKPSEYWKRQCRATFQYDEAGVRLIDVLGEDTLMWGSDFPHPDGVWPDSQQYIREQFAHLPSATRRKVICDNAATTYGLTG